MLSTNIYMQYSTTAFTNHIFNTFYIYINLKFIIVTYKKTNP